MQTKPGFYGSSSKVSKAEEKITNKKSKKKKDSDDDFGMSSLEDHGVHFFNGEVDGGSTGDAIRFILEANLDTSCRWEYMTFIINSCGGYLNDGFALIDIMNGSRIPIRTLGIGLIASMGLMIFLAGQRGYRTLTPNTMILSHQYSGATFGKEHELVASREEQDQTTDIVMRHYRRTTGLKDADIKKHLLPPHDVWVTATKAKKLGICDLVKDVKPHQMKQEKRK